MITKHTLLIASILAVVLLAGCKPNSQNASSESSGTAAKQLDKAKAAGNDAADRMQDYTFDQKTRFVSDMKTELAALNENITEISAKIEKSSAAVQADAKPKLAALREQAAQLNQQLQAVVDSTPSTWSGIKADYEKAYASLKNGVNQSRQWVSDKIAP